MHLTDLSTFAGMNFQYTRMPAWVIKLFFLFRYLIVIGLVWFTGDSRLFSQFNTLEVDIQKFGPQEGLFLSRFTGIFKDSTDVLWVLGQNKKLLSDNGQFVVTKYDGERFNQYPPLDLKANRLFGALPYRETEILLHESTQSKLYIYDKLSNKTADITYEDIPVKTIYSVHVQDDKIYCFTVKQDGKHAVYVFEKGQWAEIFESEHLKKTMWIQDDPHGFWVLKSDKILYLKKNGELIHQFLEDVGSSYTCAKTNRGMEIYPVNGNPYIIDLNTGVRKQNRIFHGVKSYPYIIQTDKKGNTIYIFNSYDLQFRVFVVTKDEKIFELNGLEQEISDVKNVAGDDFLKSFWIVKTFDLMKVDVKPKFTKSYLINAEHRKIQRFSNKIYLSTESSGLYASDYGQELNFVKIEENNNQRLFEITDDGYTLSNYGITLLKKKGNTIQKIILEDWPLDVISLSDSLLITAGESKIYLVDKYAWKAEALPNINSGFAHVLLPAHATKVLLGGNNGLTEIDITKKKSRNIFQKETVLCITKQKENTWFFGTSSGNLYKYISTHGKDSIQKMLSLSTEIATITEDGDRRYWLATFNGIYIYDESKNELLKIDDRILTHKECNRLSSFYDAEYNRMFIGTIHGLNVFDIDKMDLEKSKLTVSLSYLEYYEGKKNKIDTIYGINTDIRKIHLSAYHRNISVGFAAGISAGKEHLYYYALVPFSQYDSSTINWINNGRNAQLSLSNIESGKYRLLIKAKSEATGVESNIVSLEIDVADYFYNQGWFYLVIFSIVGSLFYYWQQHLKNENIRLENEVSKRTGELRKDKEIIEQQAKELSKLDQAKTRFYNNISHELKTPLTLIAGPLESIKSGDYIQDEKSNRLLNLMEKNVTILTDRVEELLEINRLENKKVSVHTTPVSLSTFVDTYVQIFSEEARRLNTTLKIGGEYSGIHILADEKKLGKIVQNLISNALKYCPAGSKISVDITWKDDRLNITVKDNGPGIPSAYQSMVFDKFYQLPNQNENITGSGIGLSMVKEYVELMKGDILLTSEEGKGAEFKVSIPVGIFTEDNKIENEGSEKLVIDLPTTKTNHILVVDDNPDLRSFLSLVISDYFFVTVASHGREAVEMLKKDQTIDFILSDIMMPEMDGMALLTAVKSDDRLKRLPFIFLTAKQSEVSKFSALRLGVDDYLTKPFSKNELLLRIIRLLQNYEIRKTPVAESEKIDCPIEEDFYHKLENFVRGKLSDPTFSVDTIARELNMSERNLRRYLQQEIGMSPKDFIIEVQMNYLREQSAKNKNLSIKELAAQVGYTDHKYMKKVFFERFGYPLQAAI